VSLAMVCPFARIHSRIRSLNSSTTLRDTAEPSSPASIADSDSDDSLYTEPKRRKKSDKSITSSSGTDIDCEQASPRSKKSVKGFWRSFKRAFGNARTRWKRSLLCLILFIGYVTMTCLGAQYGRAGSSRHSSPTLARRQSLEESSSFGTDAVAASVSDAVSSATERIQSADLSLNGFQENLFAISMTWHFVVQFVVIWLISDVITPAGKKENKKKESKAAKEVAADDDKVTFKQVLKALPRAIFRDIPALFYRFIKDSFKKAYRTVRRAKKWTYIRLALLAGLWLIMLLVARQLSSLAHIARDPSAKPWSSWPDVTMLHDTLQANISGLATGERLVVASLCFWFVSITANVYCMSSFADRPAAVPADEEKALGANEKVIYA
jgi:Na+-transporting methylmalonyl-CoA/oxaloacetate decarboxylase gamma subunit